MFFDILTSMKKDCQGLLAEYDYDLPQELIAQEPVRPREAARLLVYNQQTHQVAHDTFKNIGKYLPPRSLIIFNDTKVIPARLQARKDTGGKIQIFFLAEKKNMIQAYLSPALAIGKRAYLTSKIFFEVIDQKEKTFILKPNFPVTKLDKILQKYGSTPLPPYIKNSPLTEKQAREQYQAIFARIKGSVAAPTASLHFSRKLLDLLEKQGHQIAFITLHVNLGTFAPITKQQVTSNKLHEEWFYISEKTRKMLIKAKKEKQPIIACGTTVVRALESATNNLKLITQNSKKWQKTDLFIQPGYKFKMIDGLVTNFHLPQSSLLMLVAAFAGKKQVLRLYQEATKNKYRFYSFGDGMLVL